MQPVSIHHWRTLRTHLSGQVRVTTTMLNHKRRVIHIRHTSEPEAAPLEIHDALAAQLRPLDRLMSIE